MMRHLKMFGTVAILAVSLSASVGLGSALANKTTLCSTNTNPCTGTVYGAGTIIKSQSKGEVVFTAGFATIKCGEVSGEGELQGFTASGTPWGEITATPFAKCNCTVTLLVKGTLEITTETPGTANGNGTQIGKNSRLTANCSGISCLFGTAAGGTTLGKVTGGNPAVLKVNAIVPYMTGDASNFVCTLGSGTGSIAGEMEVTAPKPLFIE
jgi:hypothetical protein